MVKLLLLNTSGFVKSIREGFNMKRFKAIMCMLLSIMIVVSFTPSVSFADEEEDLEIIVNEVTDQIGEADDHEIINNADPNGKESNNTDLNDTDSEDTDSNNHTINSPKLLNDDVSSDIDNSNNPSQQELENTQDTDLLKANEDEIQINSIEDLNNIRNSPEKNYILMCDLDLSEATSEGGIYYNNGSGWDPIGASEPCFSGCFDGNGHVIRGLYSKGTMGSNGLFGVNKGIIVNLAVQDASLEGESDMLGTIAGANHGVIGNCVVSSVIKTTGSFSQKKAGGIVGINLNEIKDCAFEGKVSVNGSCEQLASVGGIVGYNEGNISNGINKGEIVCNLSGNGTAYSGGVIGMSTAGRLSYNSNKGNVEATADNGDANGGGVAGLSFESSDHCVNYGSVNTYSSGGKSYSGGVIGYNKGPASVCINKGTVFADNNNETNNVCCGGIVGFDTSGDEDANIDTCSNEGKVSASGKSKVYVGGIAGQVNNAFVQFSFNTGDVEGSVFLENFKNNTSCGGIAGRTEYGIINNDYNTGSITANGNSRSYSCAGGMVGSQCFEGVIKECYNTGVIKGKLRAGGICAENYSYIINCYNTGTIIGMQGADYVGGIVGGNFSGASLALVYNAGRIEGGAHTCGVVGYHASGSATLVDSTIVTIAFSAPAAEQYNSSNYTYTPIGNTCTYKQMLSSNTYQSFDFDNVWKMGSGNYKFPILVNVLYAEEQNNNEVGKEDHHIFDGWKTVVAATEVSTGKQSHECAGCGITETRVTAQLKPTLPAISISKPKAAKKAATIKWKKVSKANQKKIASIQIQYSLDKNFKTGVKTITAKKTAASKKITKLTSKKTYYVRIRAYKKDAKGVHVSKWSAVKSVKAK